MQDVGAGLEGQDADAADALVGHVGRQAADRKRAFGAAARAGDGQRHAADAELVLLVVDGVAAAAHFGQLRFKLVQVGDGAAGQLARAAMPPDVLDFGGGQRGQDRLAHAGAVQRAAQPTRLDMRMGLDSVL